MNNPMFRPARAFARGLGIAAMASAVAAGAQPASQIDVNAATGANDLTRTRIVATHDLNLADPRGQRLLDRRLRVAAAYVCDVWDTSVVKRYDGFTACYNDALEGGRAQAAQRSANNDTAAIRVTA